MRRISCTKFINGAWDENVTALRIKNGKFYWLCELEEWPDCEEFNEYGLRIFAPYGSPVLLQRDCVIVNGDLGVRYADEYESTPMTYYYETEEECAKYKNAYACMLSFIRPYKSGGFADEDDYDIFIMTKEEISGICDALKDGDYIIIEEG